MECYFLAVGRFVFTSIVETIRVFRRLQSVLNAAVRLIYRLRTRDHVSDAVISLHWLRVPERIQYKLAVLGVQGSTWRCSTLPRSADPCRRLAWSTNTPFYQCQPPRGTARQTVNSRQPSLCGSTHLEYTAN